MCPVFLEARNKHICWAAVNYGIVVLDPMRVSFLPGLQTIKLTLSVWAGHLIVGSGWRRASAYWPPGITWTAAKESLCRSGTFPLRWVHVRRSVQVKTRCFSLMPCMWSRCRTAVCQFHLHNNKKKQVCVPATLLLLGCQEAPFPLLAHLGSPVPAAAPDRHTPGGRRSAGAPLNHPRP